MTNTFDLKLLRLKGALCVAEDQDVADALGMTKAAFSARKRRDAFPDDKLLALAARRPDLNLDLQFILEGESAQEKAAQMLANFGSRLVEIRGKRSPGAFSKLLGITVRELQALEAGERTPTTDEVLRLQKTHPERSVSWLFGGDAPTLDAPLDDLEVVLLKNYRASNDEGKASLRQQAAFFAQLHQQGGAPLQRGSYTPASAHGVGPVLLHDPSPYANRPHTSVVVHGNLGQQVKGTAHVGSIKVGGPTTTKRGK